MTKPEFNRLLTNMNNKLKMTSYEDPEFDSLADEVFTMKSIANFANYLDILGSEVTTTDELQAAYEHPIIIEHNGYKLQVPFCAELYHILVQFVNTCMKEF